MKTRFTILLLCCCLLGKTQQLTSLEYFFDTDPGFGNGTQVALNNTSSLDSSFNFSVNSLPQGVHTLFIRLKNSDNNWSHTIYQGNFLLWTGNSGNPQIQMLNYFIDSTNNNISIPLNPGASLDTTLSINIPDNGNNLRKLGLRLKNQTGQLGDATIADISLCSLYSPLGEFRSARFGNSYTFIDNSLYNTSQKITWMVDNVSDASYNDSKIYNYTFPSGVIGYKSVGQITGTGCRVDTVYKEVAMQGIEYISPDRGVLGNDLVMNIFGGDLDTLTQLYLQHGATTVPAYDVASYQGRMLSAIFDFHTIQQSGSSPFDNYDLHVHFSNGHDTTLFHAVEMGKFSTVYGCFQGGLQEITDHRPRCSEITVDDGTYLTTDLQGPQSIRIATWNYYTLNVTNVGTALAKETPVWIIIPAQYDVKFDIDWNVRQSLADSITVDSLPLDYYQAIDTIINGHSYQYKMYGIIPPFIYPGQTLPVNFKIRASQAVPDQIIYWAQIPMFGSPLKTAWLCVWDGLGYVPIAGCFTSLWDYGANHAGFPPGYRSDFSHGQLYGVYKDFKNLAWNVVGTGVSCGGTIVSGAKKAGAVVMKSITFWESKVATNIDRSISTINNNVASNCRTTLDYAKEKIKPILTFLGFDPNNLAGNSDYDTLQHFINNFSPQHYTVTFENLPSATANTQHVFIADTLNRDKFDFNTFRFTGYRIGDSSFSLPPSRSEIFQTTGIKDNNSLKVKFVGSFDTATGIVRCDFFSVDTSGNKLIPDTSLNGFLPPDIDGVSGTGNVRFSISAKDLNTLDTFRNVASIYFDNNAPIRTNEWMNTVDTTAPTGHIVSAFRVNDTTYKLVVQHTDIGSGFNMNRFFVKTNTDSLFRDIGRSSSDTVTLIGRINETDQIFSKAVDNVGNAQQKDSLADITISFISQSPLPLTWLSFTGRLIDDKVELKWTTANEMNTSHFDIEKATDGIGFAKIKTEGASGNTGRDNNYSALDEHPADGNNFYRLKEVDLDGRFIYSTIVKIYYSKKGYVMIAPNPATDRVTIKSSSPLAEIQLVDLTGKIVRKFSPAANDIYSLSGISKGLYFLRLISDNELQTHKLLIE